MLTGKYYVKVDSNGRVTIPARLREHLGERFVLAMGLDGCLWAYSKEQWEREILRPLQGISPFDRDQARVFRAISAWSQEVEMDKQARVVLPEPLREQAKIGEEVVFVGVLTRVEIWARENWEREEVFLQSEETRTLVRQTLERFRRLPSSEAQEAGGEG